MSNRYSPRVMNGLIEPEGQMMIVDSSGERIGELEEVYLDLRTGNWDSALVRAGQFGDRRHFVPLAGADARGEAVRVRVTKDEVRGAPGVCPGGRLSALEEEQLFDHYGILDVDEEDDHEELAQKRSRRPASSHLPPEAERSPSPRAGTQTAQPNPEANLIGGQRSEAGPPVNPSGTCRRLLQRP